MWGTDGEGDNRNESSCDSTLIANNSPILIKPLRIAEKSQIVNCEEVSKILKKIISKGIKVDLLNIKIPKVNPRNIENIKINDFIDQFIYYRNLRGYTLEQVGQVIDYKNER